jgi:hypothetical protein
MTDIVELEHHYPLYLINEVGEEGRPFSHHRLGAGVEQHLCEDVVLRAAVHERVSDELQFVAQLLSAEQHENGKMLYVSI